MSVGLALSLAPPLAYGMKVIDRASFSLITPLWALKVPSKECTAAITSLQGFRFVSFSVFHELDLKELSRSPVICCLLPE